MNHNVKEAQVLAENKYNYVPQQDYDDENKYQRGYKLIHYKYNSLK